MLIAYIITGIIKFVQVNKNILNKEPEILDILASDVAKRAPDASCYVNDDYIKSSIKFSLFVWCVIAWWTPIEANLYKVKQS
jgi:hypothetical protein